MLAIVVLVFDWHSETCHNWLPVMEFNLYPSQPFCYIQISYVWSVPESKVYGANMADRFQVGPMLAPWTLLSGVLWENKLLIQIM